LLSRIFPAQKGKNYRFEGKAVFPRVFRASPNFNNRSVKAGFSLKEKREKWSFFCPIQEAQNNEKGKKSRAKSKGIAEKLKFVEFSYVFDRLNIWLFFGLFLVKFFNQIKYVGIFYK
jgi:hypothetical protein